MIADAIVMVPHSLPCAIITNCGKTLITPTFAPKASHRFSLSVFMAIPREKLTSRAIFQ
jgi:hypothetical protein